jgi:hypothetical protein
MAALSADYLAILETALAKDFVPHLPPLLDLKEPTDKEKKKNLSRAFSAFAIHKLCEISAADAAASVVDDFGIDAVYYIMLPRKHFSSCRGNSKPRKHSARPRPTPFVRARDD